MENWKDIPGYEGHYQVSDLGRVKSLDRVIPHKINGFQKIHEKILKNGKDTGGYNMVCLCLNGNQKTPRICKLVAIAFLGHVPKEDKLHVDHIELPKTDDRLSNLQLLTNRDNCSKDRWRKNPSSRYIGVHLDKVRKKWQAQIYINGKNKHLGRFNTELEAHEAYQKALKNLS